MDNRTRTKLGLLGLGASLTLPLNAMAQDNAQEEGQMNQELPVSQPTDMQEDQGVNTGAVSLDISVDVTNEYWFRGIAQENQGLIIQPGITATFDIYEEGDYSVAGYIGTWNSLHYSDGSSTGGESAGTDNAFWESDLFAGVEVGLPNNFSADLSYIYLYNPNGGGEFTEEIDLFVSYDDSEFAEELGYGDFALSPYAGIAIETDGGSDNGDDKGVYGEIGVEPSFEVVQSEEYPVTVSVPFTAGFSLGDYYENADGDDSFFGYADIGVVAATPLDAIIPERFGSWDASAGLHLIVLGDSASDIAGSFGSSDDDVSVYGTLGLSMSY